MTWPSFDRLADGRRHRTAQLTDTREMPNAGTGARSAYPLGDGFVIPVLDGARSQWVRNVMAAGRFTLRTKGRDYPLERPEIILPAQALAAYPPLLRRRMRSIRSRDFV
jgi:hypothetical protein